MTNSITQLINAWDGGKNHDLDEDVLNHVSAELRKICHLKLRNPLEAGKHHLQTTELFHELYIKMSKGTVPIFESRTHFYRFAAHLLRRILVDLSRNYNAQKRGLDVMVSGIQIDELSDHSISYEDLDEALSQLGKHDARQEETIELQYFVGMTISEISEILETSPATVKRDLQKSKLWLRKFLKDGAI